MLRELYRHSITQQRESYNLQAIIAGEHVTLTCIDNACESLKPGTYEGVNYGGNTNRYSRFPT